MNLGEALYRYLKGYAGLSALVGARIYPLIRDQKDGTLPAITYQRISRPRVHTMGNDPGLNYPRYQIDCWDDDHAGAENVANQVIDALKNQRDTTWGGDSGVTIQASIIENDREFYEEETETFRVSVDVIIWNVEE